MASVTVGGYTYTLNSDNSVTVRGPGMRLSGNNLGDLSTLSADSFVQVATTGVVTPEAAAAMRFMASSGDWTQVKAGLTEPESTNADPAVAEQEENPNPGQQEAQTNQQNNQYNTSGSPNDENENSSPVVEKQTIPNTQVANKPGKRMQNPLGNFASYTYNLSLYMISPDAYDAFIASGRRNVNALRDAAGGINGPNANNGGGAYLICQSGGINNTASIRADGFDLDYYIDNLKIITNTNGKETKSATNISEITFKITEPYGFSFISNLKRAQDQLQKQSKTKNYSNLTNPTRQFFILGIRFYGYDINGNIITSKQTFNGNVIDPANSMNGIFERFYDIIIKNIHFKIEGRATVYNIEAVPIPPDTAFNLKKGRIDNITKITAKTVEDALSGPDGLLTKLNAEQVKRKNAGSIDEPSYYRVRWEGPETDPNEKFNDLRISSIVLPSDLDKSKMPAGQEARTETSTEATAAKSSPDTTKREVTFRSDTSILAAIEQIIKQSSYLSNALKVIQISTEEFDESKKSPEEIPNNNPAPIKWYNLSSEISNARWDNKLGDFAYDITYVIQPYATPVLTAAYVNDKNLRYYGPHKRYDYWYTGKNSEVLQYEQTLNNSYFNVVLDGGDAGDAPKGGSANVPLTYKGKKNTSSLGKLGPGPEAPNAYVTSLYDPGAWATAKIKILGDPDFLMQESPGSINQVYNQFYGTDGFTVNPNGGQVFIEINFKEGEDYKIGNGLMSINESIYFWKYPKKVQEDINSRGGGVSYMVKRVVSNFEGGKFIQDIEAIINTFPNDTLVGAESTSPGERQQLNAFTDPRSTLYQNPSNNLGTGTSLGNNNTTPNTGLTQDTPVQTSNNVVGQTPNPTNQSASQPTVETNTGPVADGDGGFE